MEICTASFEAHGVLLRCWFFMIVWLLETLLHSVRGRESATNARRVTWEKKARKVFPWTAAEHQQVGKLPCSSSNKSRSQKVPAGSLSLVSKSSTGFFRNVCVILQDGINWLAFLNKYKLHGILCDGNHPNNAFLDYLRYNTTFGWMTNLIGVGTSICCITNKHCWSYHSCILCHLFQTWGWVKPSRVFALLPGIAIFETRSTRYKLTQSTVTFHVTMA